MQTTFGCLRARLNWSIIYWACVTCSLSVQQSNLQKCRALTVELGQKDGDHIQLRTKTYTIKSRVSLFESTLGHS